MMERLNQPLANNETVDDHENKQVYEEEIEDIEHSVDNQCTKIGYGRIERSYSIFFRNLCNSHIEKLSSYLPNHTRIFPIDSNSILWLFYFTQLELLNVAFSPL